MLFRSDEKFAKALAKHLYEVKNYSDNHVRQELYKRGISREIVYDIIDNSEIDSIETIINLVIKKYYNKLNAENGKEKVVAALMRKGFSYGDIKTALHRIENKDYV